VHWKTYCDPRKKQGNVGAYIVRQIEQIIQRAAQTHHLLRRSEKINLNRLHAGARGERRHTLEEMEETQKQQKLGQLW
jgi:transposase